MCNAKGGLEMNFYRQSCPQAEKIVNDIICKTVPSNTALPAKLLRMHFHDCFVNGCDGSILLDAVNGTQAEKDAIPNLTLAGFDVIDEIKKQIELECPYTVSCADILALAARDAFSFLLNLLPAWEVPTGRRDGTVSLASNANANIPSPFSDFDTLLSGFKSKGLDLTDLVVLSGGHTIGVAHCPTFSPRLYNFTGKGDQDPSLNPLYAAYLKQKCPNSANNAGTAVPLDPLTPKTLDRSYYQMLLAKKGLLTSDAALLTNKQSAEFVLELATPFSSFFSKFRVSMKKMGAIEVLTGTAGQIRKDCRVVN